MRSHSRTLTSSSGRLKQCEHVQMNTRQFSVSQPLSDRSGQINSQDVSGEQLLYRSISSAPLPSTLGRWHSRAASMSSLWWMCWWRRGAGPWAPIRRLLGDRYQWATSWNICRLVIHHRWPGSCCRDWWTGHEVPGRRAAAPFEVFISVLSLHDQSDSGAAAALWQGQYSAAVINQWFPLMIRGSADGFLGRTVAPALSDPCRIRRLLLGSKTSAIKRRPRQKSHFKMWEVDLEKCRAAASPQKCF